MLPGNSEFELVMVLIPVLSKALTEATPIFCDGVCMTLALKVLIPAILSPTADAVIPVLEKTDFTSEIPKEVISVATRFIVLACVEIPLLKTRTSFLINLPF